MFIMFIRKYNEYMQGTVSCVSFCFSANHCASLMMTWRWRSPIISVISTIYFNDSSLLKMHSFFEYECLSYLIMHIILMLLFCVYECLSYLIMHNMKNRTVTHSIIHIIIVHDFTVRPLPIIHIFPWALVSSSNFGVTQNSFLQVE